MNHTVYDPAHMRTLKTAFARADRAYERACDKYGDYPTERNAQVEMRTHDLRTEALRDLIAYELIAQEN